MACWKCKQDIPEGINICPNCGEEQKFDKKEKKWVAIVAVIGIAILLGIGMLFFAFIRYFAIVLMAAGFIFLVYAYGFRTSWLVHKYQKNSQIELSADIAPEELINTLRERNFQYPGLIDTKLTDEGHVAFQLSRGTYTAIIQNGFIEISAPSKWSENRALRAHGEGYKLAQFLQRFLYPEREIDLAAISKKVNRQGMLRPVLSYGLAALFVLFLLANEQTSYAINMMTQSHGVALQRLNGQSDNLGNTFEKYFDSPKWTAYKVGAAKYTDFSGRVEVFGEPSNIILTFAVFDDGPIVEDCTINGMSVGPLVGYALIDAAYTRQPVETYNDEVEYEPEQPAMVEPEPMQEETVVPDSNEYKEQSSTSDAEIFVTFLREDFSNPLRYIEYGSLGDYFLDNLEYTDDDKLYELFFGAAEIEISVAPELLNSDNDGWPEGTSTWNLFQVITNTADTAYEKSWWSDLEMGQVWLSYKLEGYPFEVEMVFWINYDEPSYSIYKCYITSLEDGSDWMLEGTDIQAFVSFLSAIWQEGPTPPYYFPEYIEMD